MCSVHQPETRPQGRAFALDVHFEHPILRRLWPVAQPALEKAAGLTALEAMYNRAAEQPTIDAFLPRALLELDVGWEANDLDMARIPRTGGCIIIANHPFGAVEGIVLLAMLRAMRTDVKVIANFLLGRLDALREGLILADPFGSADATGGNSRAAREAVRFARAGGIVALFPAGEVAHLDLASRTVVDPPWGEALGRLIRMAKVPVLPMFFAGHNGPFFQLAGAVHPRLRTALLVRELINKRGHQIEVRVGALISQNKLNAFSTDREMVAYLRNRTLMLGQRAPRKPRRSIFPKTGVPLPLPPWSVRAEPEPIAAAGDPARLAAEIDSLPVDQILLDEKGRVVCYARAPQIPAILAEIGRLREITFREAQEGTGRATDLDDFDRHYLHLFVFDRKDRAIVGAYRLGPTDELLARGPRGLYTSTLFEMQPELFRQMGPALEMGRSFVCAQYQRSASGLFLLWRGIGQFVARFPRYRTLFGPVSISSAYTQVSRELMVDFIKLGDHMHPLTRYVRARHPFSRRRLASLESGLPDLQFFGDIEEISGLVADIEADQKGVPVLFKQYLKLGGRMLGFNVDAQFSGVLDGLILVDLLRTDVRILSRYLGPTQTAAFLGHHRVEGQVAG
jgi:putative hemolysin